MEAVSQAFGRLPDPVLLPWLPTLVTTLRAGGADLAPLLIREAGRTLPGRLEALDTWTPPWREQPEAPSAGRPDAGHGCELLAGHPGTGDAVAGLLGWGTWESPGSGRAGVALAGRHPDTALALEALLAC